MSREFELKYRGSDATIDALHREYGDFATISMETTYYDTTDGQLSARHWTFRRRYENETSICTLKTPAEGGGRCEWEVEEESIMDAVPKLCKLGASSELVELTRDGVTAVCGAKFTRLAKTLEIPDATVELALDRGCLMGGGREIPLREIEIEVKSGSEHAAIGFAKLLEQKYGLIPEPKSKYRRALGLAKGEF